MSWFCIRFPCGSVLNSLEHLRAALSHDIILRDEDIPQLCKSWDNNITDLVSGIPLKLLVNHEINLIGEWVPCFSSKEPVPLIPKNISTTSCQNAHSISAKSSLTQLRDTPLHSGGYLKWHIKQCQCFAYQIKMVNYILFSIHENRMITWSRT